MAASRAFAQALVRARKALGFPSGHAFYKARGGRRAVGMLYANYMALERGVSLPKPGRLPALLEALELGRGAEGRRELLRAYLVSVLDSEELLRELDARTAAAPLTGEDVARQSLRHRSAQLDLAQWRALASDPAAYYSHVYLLNTPGWSSLAEVAAAVGLPAARVRQGLTRLAQARVIERSGSRARSKLEYRFLRALPSSAATLPVRSVILRHREAFAGPRGELVRRSTLTSRISRAGLERYAERLADTVRLLGAYGDAEKDDETDVFYVDARIFKIFD